MVNKYISLKTQTLRGIAWNFVELVFRRGAGGLTTLILTWFLAPEDFGLIAIMAVFLALSNVLVDAGFSQALIRKPKVSAREYDTVFYSNIGLALLVYGLLFGTAPYIASFYEEPRLLSLIRITGFAIIFSAFTVVQRAVLSRELKFKLQMQASLPAALVSGVTAIIVAYFGYGVWALVTQIILQSLLTALLYFRLGLWRPRLQFGWSEFKELFSFGGYLLLAQSINIPFRYMYVLVIAKLFSAPLVGLYYFAEKIRNLLVEQLTASIQTVTYPVLSRLQEEPKRLKEGYRQIVSVMTFIMFPILIFLAALVENVFFVFLPHQWSDAGLYLQLMCFSALLYPLNSVNLNILKVKGRSELVLYLGVVKKILTVAVFVVSIRYGVIGILIGQMVSSLIAFLPNSYFSKRLIGYSVAEQLADFIPALLISSLLGGILWWFQYSLRWNPLLELIFLSGFGIVFYLIFARLLRLKAFSLFADLFKKGANFSVN